MCGISFEISVISPCSEVDERMAVFIYLEAMSLALMLWHVMVCPYTKVEESFNIQAIHDVIFHRTNLIEYDHLEFPGVVPRSFLGPIIISALTSPLIPIVNLVNENKLVTQYTVRCVLGFCVLLGFWSFTSAVKHKLGCRTGNLLILVTASQFHFMFYISRPLPNVFALCVVLFALSHWLRQRYVKFLWCSGVAILIFRSELALYFGIIVLMELVSRRLGFLDFLKTSFVAGPILLFATVMVDSYFWRRWLWPEGEVLWFNTVMNKSSQWGTSPFLWYFYSALPRALSFSLFFVPVGMYMSAAVRQLVNPALVFVLLFSILPHKELRFIIYTFPVLNVAVAHAINRCWQNRKKSQLQKLLSFAAILHLGANLCTTGVFLYTSHLNYPGGTAIDRLHQLESPFIDVHVHIDVATAQTGVTRFTQCNPNWIYNKTEDLVAGGPEMMSYTHMLLGDPDYKDHYGNTHQVLEVITGFDGLSINKNNFPFIKFKISPKIWILKKKLK